MGAGMSGGQCRPHRDWPACRCGTAASACFSIPSSSYGAVRSCSVLFCTHLNRPGPTYVQFDICISACTCMYCLSTVGPHLTCGSRPDKRITCATAEDQNWHHPRQPSSFVCYLCNPRRRWRKKKKGHASNEQGVLLYDVCKCSTAGPPIAPGLFASARRECGFSLNVHPHAGCLAEPMTHPLGSICPLAGRCCTLQMRPFLIWLAGTGLPTALYHSAPPEPLPSTLTTVLLDLHAS